MRRFLTVEQVADLLDLHVKTVRGYVRDGRLRATKVGKQYRIARDDLNAFVGGVDDTAPGAARHAEVSSVVHIEGIDPDATMRLTNTVLATAVGSADDRTAPLRVETVYHEDRRSLKIIVIGDLEATADALRVIQVLADES